jgi:YD repeat-containing protein
MDDLSGDGRGWAVELAARIEEIVEGVLVELKRRFATADVEVISVGGDVAVSVDRSGRLVELRLAAGSTARFTYDALERLINDTLNTAVDIATQHRRDVGVCMSA